MIPVCVAKVGFESPICHRHTDNKLYWKAL